MTPPGVPAVRFGSAVATQASRADAVVRAPKHYVFTGISLVPLASIIGCALVVLGLGVGLCLVLLSRPRRRPLHRRQAPSESSGAAQLLHGFRMTVVEERPPAQREVPPDRDPRALPEPAPAHR